MAIQKANKKFRQVDGRAVEDPSNIDNLLYNEAAGAQKNLQVGPFLQPLNDGSGGYTTNAAAATRAIRKGSIIAVYNNGATLFAVTFGSASPLTALASGVADVNGNVGMPCKPNDWSYFNSDDKQFIRAENAALLVFVVKDESYISAQG